MTSGLGTGGCINVACICVASRSGISLLLWMPVVGHIRLITVRRARNLPGIVKVQLLSTRLSRLQITTNTRRIPYASVILVKGP